MDEEQARVWMKARFGPSAVERVGAFVNLVADEAARQNLIAPSTQQTMWNRHVVDSAQLLTIAGDRQGTWLDIGTGAGFPGMIVALLRALPTVLVEPRAKRAQFLAAAAERLALPHVSVIQRKVEQVAIPASIISARAVAPLSILFASALPCSTAATSWLLPKGRTASDELAAVRRDWRGVFHVEQSVTDPDAAIVVASEVARR